MVGERHQRVAVLADGLRQFVHDGPHLGRLRHARRAPRSPRRSASVDDACVYSLRMVAMSARRRLGALLDADEADADVREVRGTGVVAGRRPTGAGGSSASTAATSSSSVTPLLDRHALDAARLELREEVAEGGRAARHRHVADDHLVGDERDRRRSASSSSRRLTTSANDDDVARDERVAGRVELRRRAARRRSAGAAPRSAPGDDGDARSWTRRLDRRRGVTHGFGTVSATRSRSVDRRTLRRRLRQPSRRPLRNEPLRRRPSRGAPPARPGIASAPARRPPPSGSRACGTAPTTGPSAARSDERLDGVGSAQHAEPPERNAGRSRAARRGTRGCAPGSRRAASPSGRASSPAPRSTAARPRCFSVSRIRFSIWNDSSMPKPMSARAASRWTAGSVSLTSCSRSAQRLGAAERRAAAARRCGARSGWATAELCPPSRGRARRRRSGGRSAAGGRGCASRPRACRPAWARASGPMAAHSFFTCSNSSSLTDVQVDRHLRHERPADQPSMARATCAAASGASGFVAEGDHRFHQAVRRVEVAERHQFVHLGHDELQEFLALLAVGHHEEQVAPGAAGRARGSTASLTVVSHAPMRSGGSSVIWSPSSARDWARDHLAVVVVRDVRACPSRRAAGFRRRTRVLAKSGSSASGVRSSSSRARPATDFAPCRGRAPGRGRRRPGARCTPRSTRDRVARRTSPPSGR